MKYGDIIFTILEFACMLFLFWLAGYAVRVLHTKWKLCYLVPAVLCMVAVTFLGYERLMLGVYIGAMLPIVGFFLEKKTARQLVSVLGAVLVAVSVPICILNPGYRMPDFVEDFHTGFSKMKQYYVLTEHKQIDFDMLYDKYLPQFEEANRHHDSLENYFVWIKFCQEFHDGHVSFAPVDAEEMSKEIWKYMGNDYGLSLMPADDGTYLAVNVIPELAELGIVNGTTVVSWDKRTIPDVIADLTCMPGSFPDKENEAFYSGIVAAGVGGDSVEVTVLNADGTERAVTLEKRSDYPRIEETCETINKGIAEENFSWHELNENTVCLRLTDMMYDSESYESGDHTKMQEELRAKLLEYKAQGMTNMIFDLRSNGGGSPQLVNAIAALFSPEGAYDTTYPGVWDDEKKAFKKDMQTGKYVHGDSMTYNGENLWDGGRIVVLVNAYAVSAADYFTYVFHKLPNVTVMGFTRSNSSCQAVNGVPMESGMLTFSGVPNLTKDGDIIIDTPADRSSTMPLDVKIPFNKDAAVKIFDNGEDYVLDYAMQYLADK